MPVSTRHKSALRRAEGHPPSPQNEDDLPRELRANTRRSRKAPRSIRANRSTITPDTDDDGGSKQDQVATAQALREGNAGGYVVHNSTAAVSATAAAVAKAEAEAAENQHQSSNKRRREDETDINHNAQRRRLNSAASPTPMSTSTFNSLRMRSRLRFKARSASQSQTATASPHQLFPPDDPLRSAPSTVNYRRDGSLQLIGGAGRTRPQNGVSAENPVAQGITTTNDSDDEGESEGILLFPNMASANRAMFGDNPGLGLDTPVQSSANANERSVNGAHVTPPPTDQAQDGEPRTSVAETPQTTGWGLGSLFNSARRFIPGMRGQRTPLAAPQTNAPIVRTLNTPDVHDAANSQHGALTEPRQQDHHGDVAAVAPSSNFAQRLRESQAATQKSFRNKESIEEIKQLRVEKERLKAEWARLEKERKVTEKERQDVEDAHRAAYADQQPGSKRPHKISPRVIPNPKGVSYGLDPAYFDSSDEDEEPSPLRFRPRKARRVSGPDRSNINEDSELTGGVSAPFGNEALRYRGSRFSDSPPNIFSVSTAKDSKRAHTSQDTSSSGPRINDPGFNYSGHFSVPLSSSSSEEESEDELKGASPDIRAGKRAKSSPSEKARSDNQISEDAAVVSHSSKTGASPSEKGRRDSHVSDHAASKKASSKTNVLPSQPPMTPMSQQAGAEGRLGKHTDASKTLEQRRQDLRAKLAGKKGKSVLSPKDIATSSLQIKSPSKVPQSLDSRLSSQGSTTSKEQKSPSKRRSSKDKPPTSGAGSSASGSTSNEEQKKPSQRRSSQDRVPIPPSDKPQSKTLGGSGVNAGSQSSPKPGEDEGFNIRGPASRGVEKSPQRRLAETLPSIYGSVSHLHAFEDFEPKLDGTIKKYLESSWENRDDEASTNAFKSAFTAYRVPEQQIIQPQAASTVSKPLGPEPSFNDLEDDEDDDAASAALKTSHAGSSGDDLEDNEDEEPTATSELSAQTTSVGDQTLDPAVMAFLNSQWTTKDGFYATGNFEDQYKESKAVTDYTPPNIAA